MWCWDVSLCKHARSSVDEDGIYLCRWLNEHPSVSQKKVVQDHEYEHKAGMPGLEISCHFHLSFIPFGEKEGMVAPAVFFLLLNFSPNYLSVTWADPPGQLWWGEEQCGHSRLLGKVRGNEGRSDWGARTPLSPPLRALEQSPNAV